MVVVAGDGDGVFCAVSGFFFGLRNAVSHRQPVVMDDGQSLLVKELGFFSLIEPLRRTKREILHLAGERLHEGVNALDTSRVSCELEFPSLWRFHYCHTLDSSGVGLIREHGEIQIVPVDYRRRRRWLTMVCSTDSPEPMSC